ncbi:hypothetical protein PRZ48_015147 [Zasmidium cellare]|uniref:Uncharacterized protein n=1 Tax=Zasmidium cellare TaxID=395010 RepID=A0ABR0DYE6_ZASCE|nr:hypothetical protein PRZ48_015147 [Zasmidium cellare]
MTSRKPPSPAQTSHPAPWTLKGEMYWLIAKAPTPLPKTAYHPLEQAAINGNTNDFRGGMCYTQIVRYSDSPVGPYDELAIVPGVFGVPGGKLKGKKKMRVTRIYVSGRETMFDGRKNWNIPKHLARFEFSAPLSRKGEAPPRELKVAVYPPDTAEGGRVDAPFFKATLTPWRWLPAVPMSTKYLPLDSTLVQPPLLQGDDPYLAGTEKWRVVPSLMVAKCRLMWVQMDHESTKTQDEHWPQQIKPWSFGIWMEEGTFDFGVSAEEFTV